MFLLGACFPFCLFKKVPRKLWWRDSNSFKLVGYITLANKNRFSICVLVRSYNLVIVWNNISRSPSTVPNSSMNKTRTHRTPSCCSRQLASTKDEANWRKREKASIRKKTPKMYSVSARVCVCVVLWNKHTVLWLLYEIWNLNNLCLLPTLPSWLVLNATKLQWGGKKIAANSCEFVNNLEYKSDLKTPQYSQATKSEARYCRYDVGIGFLHPA